MAPDQVVVVRVQLVQMETTTAVTAAYMAAAAVRGAAFLVAAAQAAQAVKVLLFLPTLWLRPQVGMLLREIKALTLSQVKLPMFCLGDLLLL
jgi:hypothetical protein